MTQQKMVGFKTSDGNDIFVRADAVLIVGHLNRQHDTTRMLLVDGSSVIIKGTPEDVLTALSLPSVPSDMEAVAIERH